MLPRVIEIDDLRGSGKMIIGEVPDPGSAIAENHSALGSTPTSLPSLMVETYSEFLRRLDGPAVGCGSLITNGTTFFVDTALREYAAQFGLSRTGSLPCDFPDTTFGFRGHHRHARAIHLDVQHGDLRTPHRGKFELQCSLPLGLLTGSDITADGLRVALHRFGRDLQPSQCFQLLAPLCEAAVATDQRHHASHSRRTFRIHYIQLHIPRALPLVARRA